MVHLQPTRDIKNLQISQKKWKNPLKQERLLKKKTILQFESEGDEGGPQANIIGRVPRSEQGTRKAREEKGVIKRFERRDPRDTNSWEKVRCSCNKKMEKACYRGFFVAHSEQLQAHRKVGKQMATDGNHHRSKKNYNRGENDSNRNCMQNKLSQYEVHKEIEEMKARLKFVEMMLDCEDHRQRLDLRMLKFIIRWKGFMKKIPKRPWK